MPYPEPIAVRGLKDFRAELKALEDGAQVKLRLVFNSSADAIVADARSRVPTRSGRARKSIRARSTQTSARVLAGGKRVPYYGWLDFGGRVGRNRSNRRPFLKDGRYIYPAYYAQRSTTLAMLEEAMGQLIQESGLDR